MALTALVAVALLSGTPGLRLSLDAPKTWFPMEALPVVFTLEATKDLPAVLSLVGGGMVWFEVKGPGGTREYRESRMYEEMIVLQPLPAGESRSHQVVLAQGHDGYLFPTPGSYRLRLRYDDAKRDLHASSRWIEVDVGVPTRSDDIAVLEGLRRGVPSGELRTAHPESRYWWLGSFEALRSRCSHIHNGVDPETYAYVPRSEREAWRKAQYRDVLAQLERLAAEGQDWWERVALTQAQVLAENVGEGAKAAELAARLDAKYPGWTDVPEFMP